LATSLTAISAAGDQTRPDLTPLHPEDQTDLEVLHKKVLSSK